MSKSTERFSTEQVAEILTEFAGLLIAKALELQTESPTEIPAPEPVVNPVVLTARRGGKLSAQSAIDVTTALSEWGSLVTFDTDDTIADAVAMLADLGIAHQFQVSVAKSVAVDGRVFATDGYEEVTAAKKEAYNKAGAAWLREQGIEPAGQAWTAHIKHGERSLVTLRKLNAADGLVFTAPTQAAPAKVAPAKKVKAVAVKLDPAAQAKAAVTEARIKRLTNAGATTEDAIRIVASL